MLPIPVIQIVDLVPEIPRCGQIEAPVSFSAVPVMTRGDGTMLSF